MKKKINIAALRFFAAFVPFFLFFGFICAAENEQAVFEEIYHHHTGTSHAGGGCYYRPIYHVHTGNYISGGGCYGQRVQVNAHQVSSYTGSGQKWTCYSCGAIGSSRDESWSCSCGKSGHYLTFTCPNGHNSGGVDTRCSNSAGTTEYRLSCGKLTSTPEYYELSCKTEENEYLGSWEIHHNPTSWTREVTLTAFFKENLNLHTTSFLWSNGESGEETTITENGTYSCSLTYQSYQAPAQTTSLVLEISNIDREPPTAAILWDDSEWEVRKYIYIEEAFDEKCGLSETPYRIFDGTKYSEWSDNSEFIIEENGTYQVEIRDALDNIYTQEITFEHIDYTPPKAVITCDDSQWELSKKIQITEASDDQSGLAAEPYRFFDGNSWSVWGENDQWEVSQNGIYLVEIRDAIHNVYQEKVPITHADSNAPLILLAANPGGWTRGNVEVRVLALDEQDTVSVSANEIQKGKGIGLDDKPYAWNGSDLWTDKDVILCTENGPAAVSVKDKLGNTASAKIEVNNIDRLAPDLSVEASETENGYTLTAKASDSGSGMHTLAYSWDGGTTWTNETVSSVTFTDIETMDTDVINMVICVNARDVVGNIATANVCLTKEKEKQETEGTTTVKKEKKEDVEEIEEEQDEEQKPKEKPAKQSTPEQITEEIEKESKISFEKCVLWISLLLLLFLLLMNLLYFRLFQSCKVYGINKHGKFHWIGNCLIHKKDKQHYVVLSDRLLGKGEKYKLVFPEEFIQTRENQQMFIKHSNHSVVTPEFFEIKEKCIFLSGISNLKL